MYRKTNLLYTTFGGAERTSASEKQVTEETLMHLYLRKELKKHKQGSLYLRRKICELTVLTVLFYGHSDSKMLAFKYSFNQDIYMLKMYNSVA